jgi:hypothetical protein
MWLLSEGGQPSIPGWRRVERRPSTLVPSRPSEPVRRAVVERWVRDEE